MIDTVQHDSEVGGIEDSNRVRLLVIVQALDHNDPTLSFFLPWVRELARHYESLNVVCLKKGLYDLPKSVQVFSLGKETARGAQSLKRISYIARLWRYAWKHRSEYDAVLIFQNQEYPLTTGWLWKVLGKKVYFWRNHYSGNWVTNIAISFCEKVFYTSRFSYTARFPNAVRMPVGIDTDVFRAVPSIERDRRGILFLGRMAPSKNPSLLIDALELLHAQGIPFHATFVGDPLPTHSAFYAALKKRVADSAIAESVTFAPGMPNTDIPLVYSAHTVSVNASASGMYDKTMFEAAACGCLVLASSNDFASVADPRCIFEEGNAQNLALKMEKLLALSETERSELSRGLETIVAENTVRAFGSRLAEEIL